MTEGRRIASLASGGVSIRTRDRYFAAGLDGATKTQCHWIVWRWSTPHYYYLLSTNSIHMRVYRFSYAGYTHGWCVSPPRAAPHRRCQARPNGPPLREVFLIMTSLVWRSGSSPSGDETLTAWHSSELNCFSTGLNSTLCYSHCCPLLYPSPATCSISSCLQQTLTEVTHLVDPWSGSWWH